MPDTSGGRPRPGTDLTDRLRQRGHSTECAWVRGGQRCNCLRRARLEAADLIDAIDALCERMIDRPSAEAPYYAREIHRLIHREDDR